MPELLTSFASLLHKMPKLNFDKRSLSVIRFGNYSELINLATVHLRLNVIILQD